MRKSLSSFKWLPVGAVLFLATLTVANAAPSGPGGSGYLDSIATQFQSATSGWMAMAQGYAFKIFGALALLDLAWWGIKNLLKKNDIADYLTGVALKITSLAFFFTVLTYAPTWMPLIPQSFMQMGQNIGGASAAGSTPSGVMSMAFSVVDKLYQVYNTAPGGLTHIGSNLFLAIVIAVTSLLALIGFGLVALQLLMTLIEMYLVGGAGLVMLGFTGASFTSSFGEKYIGYMVSIGIKLLIIYAIIGLGSTLITNEIAYINGYIGGGSALPPTDLMTVGVSMLIYGVIGMQAPGLASSLMNGSPNMSLGNVAGGAAAIAGGVAAAGAAGVAAYAGGVKGLQSLADKVGAGTGAAGGLGGSSTDKLAALGGMTGGGAGGATGPGGAAGKSGSLGTSTPGGTGMGPSGGPASASGGMAAVEAGQSSRMMMDNKLQSGALQSGPASSAGPGGAKPTSARFDKPDAAAAGGSPGAPGGAPASGNVDSLGAQATAGKGGAAEMDGKAPSDVLKKSLENLVNKKEDIARHEGGGGGLQIRLGHAE